jgi:hypothetical protein
MVNIVIAQEPLVNNNKNADDKQETLGRTYSREDGLIPLSSRITFFRPHFPEEKDAYSIEVNGDYHASLQSGGYSDLCVKVKHVLLKLQTILPNGDKSAVYALDADLLPRDDLYVRVKPKGGMARMELVSAEVAQAELLEKRRQMHTVSREPCAKCSRMRVGCAKIAGSKWG